MFLKKVVNSYFYLLSHLLLIPVNYIYYAVSVNSQALFRVNSLTLTDLHFRIQAEVLGLHWGKNQRDPAVNK